MLGLIAAAASAWVALLVLAPLLPVPVAGLTYLFGSLILGSGSGVRGFGVHERFTVRGSRALVIAGALPTAVTVVLEWAGVWSPSNLARAVAGAALGASVAFVTLHYAQCARRRPIVPSPPPTPI